MKAAGVDVTVPRAGIDLRKVDGEVPVNVSLSLAKDGVELRHDESRSPYSTLRFTDQHPLLKRSGFLSIGSIKISRT